MKKLVLMILLSISIISCSINSEPDIEHGYMMKCWKTTDDIGYNIKRCENKETICYTRMDSGMDCHFKAKFKIKDGLNALDIDTNTNY
jgi:hypothetical protein